MAELLWWHRVGQKVVCVDDSAKVEDGFELGDVCPLLKDAIYTVREVFLDPAWLEHGAHFRLKEVRGEICLWSGENGWRNSRFRPVRETSINSLRALIKPMPDMPSDLRREVYKEMIDEAAHG